MEKNVFEDRIFKFWYYHVSHGVALVRSPKSKEYLMNIDIYCAAVEYIEIPYILTNLKIIEAEKSDVLYLSDKLGMQILPKDIIVLVSNNKKFFIVAPIIKIMENSLEMLELPFTVN